MIIYVNFQIWRRMKTRKRFEDFAYLFFSLVFMSLVISMVWWSSEVLPIECSIPLAFFGIPFSTMVLLQLNDIRNRDLIAL